MCSVAKKHRSVISSPYFDRTIFFTTYLNSLARFFSRYTSSPGLTTPFSQMSSNFGLLHYPLKLFIYLKRKFFYFIFGRSTLDKDDSDGFTSAGSHTLAAHTLHPLDEPHFPFIFPPLTSLLGDHFQPPQSFKRKALLVGVEDSDELPMKRGLKGPHKDIRDMHQLLIGKFKFNGINISNSTFAGRSVVLSL